MKKESAFSTGYSLPSLRRHVATSRMVATRSPADSDPLPTRRAHFDLREDEEIELEELEYDEPSTPTFSELKRSLSLANLRDIEVKKAVWRPATEPHKRPRDFEQVFAHALTGGARTSSFTTSQRCRWNIH